MFNFKSILNNDIHKLCQFLFDGKSLTDLLPPFPTNRGLPKQPTLVNCKRAMISELPKGIRDYELSDSFITRLHFVLNEDEVANYRAWKVQWERLLEEDRF